MQIKCPYCGSWNIAGILWGTPAMTEELMQEINQGTTVLGGCKMNENSPTLQCNDCRKKFGREPVCSIRGKHYRPDDLSEIEFYIGGYFSGYDTVVIRKEENRRAVCVWHMPEDADKPLYIRPCPKREWESLKKALFNQLFVHEWKLSYADNDILDGTQWSLKLTFNDGKKREIYGSNDFPTLWDPFMRRFGRFIHESQEKKANPVDIYRYRDLFREHTQIQDWIKDHDFDLLESIMLSGASTVKRLDRFHELYENLRRNQKHEHNSYFFHCEHCDYEDDIYVGVGMGFPAVYNEIVKKIEAGYYGVKWQALFTGNPKAIVDGSLSLYVCSSCGHYMSDYNLGMFVLKDGLTDKELTATGQDHPDGKMHCVYLYSMSWPLQYYRKIGSFVHRCPVCNKRMHAGGYKDHPKCPKCGKNGNIEHGRIMWD